MPFTRTPRLDIDLEAGAPEYGLSSPWLWDMKKKTKLTLGELPDDAFSHACEVAKIKPGSVKQFIEELRNCIAFYRLSAENPSDHKRVKARLLRFQTLVDDLLLKLPSPFSNVPEEQDLNWTLARVYRLKENEDPFDRPLARTLEFFHKENEKLRKTLVDYQDACIRAQVIFDGYRKGPASAGPRVLLAMTVMNAYVNATGLKPSSSVDSPAWLLLHECFRIAHCPLENPSQYLKQGILFQPYLHLMAKTALGASTRSK